MKIAILNCYFFYKKNYMKYIYLFIFIFHFSSSFSQFEVIIESEESPVTNNTSEPFKILELQDGNLLISQSNLPNCNIKLYKLNSDGEVLFTNTLDTNNFKSYMSNNDVQISPFQDEHILIMGQNKNYLNNPCFIEVDENFEIVENNVFMLPDQDSIISARFESFIVNKQGNLVFKTRGYFEREILPNENYYMLYEIDIVTKDTIRTKTIPFCRSFNPVSDVMQIENENYYLFSSYLFSGDYITKLSEDLSIIDTINLLYLVHEGYNFIAPNGVNLRAKSLTDSTFIVSFLMDRVNISTFSDDFCLGSAIIDTNFNTVEVAHIRDTANNDVRNCMEKNLDFTDNNNIFQVGVTNVDNYYYTRVKGPNAVMVSIMDGELNLKSQHFYGYDGISCYDAIDMIATQDGGCAVVSLRRIYEDPYDIYGGSTLLSADLHLLKVNEYGTLTPVNNEKEVEISSMKLAYCYPNPAKDFFYVRYGAHLKNVSIEIIEKGKIIVE